MCAFKILDILFGLSDYLSLEPNEELIVSRWTNFVLHSYNIKISEQVNAFKEVYLLQDNLLSFPFYALGNINGNILLKLIKRRSSGNYCFQFISKMLLNVIWINVYFLFFVIYILAPNFPDLQSSAPFVVCFILLFIVCFFFLCKIISRKSLQFLISITKPN